MRQLVRYIFGIILLIGGLAAISLVIYLSFKGKQISLFNVIIPVGLGGLVLTLAGWSLLVGERVRDVIAFLFTGLWP